MTRARLWKNPQELKEPPDSLAPRIVLKKSDGEVVDDDGSWRVQTNCWFCKRDTSRTNTWRTPWVLRWDTCPDCYHHPEIQRARHLRYCKHETKPKHPVEARKPRNSELTLDEQLEAFLTNWEATRAKHIRNYQLKAERWKNDAYLYSSMKRHERHYQHEADMLAELRKRAGL